MCLGCACIDLLELRMAKQLQLLTEHSVFPDAWPAQSLAVPRLQLEQSPTRVWTPWLWVWCFLCLRNCLETCCVHNKDIVIINPMQLVPSSVLVFSFALWALCLLLCSLQNHVLQENLMPYIPALLLPSLYACALLLSLLLKLHECPWCSGLQLIEGNKCLK